MQHHEVSLAMEFLASLGRLDFDAASAFLDENVVLDLPYANDGLVLRGRDGILRFLKKTMAGVVARIEYKMERAYPSPEAGAIVLEISTQGRTPAGREYTNRLVAIFEFRGGKIALFREYFNPVGMG
jgi:ketosteroid isomerase-like protein